MSIEQLWERDEARQQKHLAKRRARDKRRYESDPEYRERKRVWARTWAANNREEKNRRNREYMRNRRANL